MGWTQPRTWSVGDVVTAAQLNEQIRDNLEELDFHDHSGGSGSGTRALGGTTGLTQMIFADAAAPAAPTGTLTAVFSTTGSIGWRPAGGGALYLAASGHEHTGSSVQSLTKHNLASGTIGTFQVLADDQTGGTISTAIALGGSGRRMVHIVTGALINYNTGSMQVSIVRDTTLLATSTFTLQTYGPTALNNMFVLSYLDVGVASGSYTYRGTFAGSGFAWVFGKALTVREISVL